MGRAYTDWPGMLAGTVCYTQTSFGKKKKSPATPQPRSILPASTRALRGHAPARPLRETLASERGTRKEEGRPPAPALRGLGSGSRTSPNMTPMCSLNKKAAHSERETGPSTLCPDSKAA